MGNDRPSAVHFPRGNGYGLQLIKDLFGTVFEGDELPARGEILEIGKGRIVKRVTGDKGLKYRVALLSIGTRLHGSVLAARAIEKAYPDVSVTVADARFMKPLDEQMIGQLATENDVLITVEEGSAGGFGSHVQNFLCNEGYLDNGTLRKRAMVIPDIWIEQGPQKDQYDIAGLNEVHIAAKIEKEINSLREYKPKSVMDVKG